MKKFILFLICLIVLLSLPNNSFAASINFGTPPSGPNYTQVSANFCGVAEECANTYTTSTSNSACGFNGCGGGLNWTKYRLTCLYDSADQDYEGWYEPQTDDRVYSIGDKCISGETGLRPGFCDGSFGQLYKRCCSGFTPVSCTQATSVFQDGIYPDEGACPSGTTETAPGVTSCPDAPPPPPPPVNFCAEAGYTACTPGSVVGSCINSSGQTCTAYSTYACNFEGQNYCDPNNPTCGAPCSAPPPPPPGPPSCAVTWNISNTNPPVNSTVNVTVNGSATPNWNGASYSLDGGGWNNVFSGPPFSFNVNSGSPGIHSLRFSTGNGSTVCSSSGINSFTTQSPNNGANCITYRVNNDNAVSAGASIPVAITMQNGSGNFTAWTSGGANPYRLGAQQPQNSANWGTTSGASSGQGFRPTRVNLSSSPIPPGGTAPFNFNATAPNTPGTYRLSFQMLQEGGGGFPGEWFGGMCQRDISVQPSAFTATCIGTITNQANRTVQWTANPSPAGSYSYSWSGDASGNTQTVTQTYATAGVKNAQVVVGSFGLTRTANCSVTIPAPFDFNLTNGGNKTVARGSAVNNSISVNLASGTTQSVSLSAAGFPSGVTHSFSPTICNPTCSSTLNITASSTAQIGNYTITITGTGGGTTRTSSFALTVTAPPPSCGNGTCNAGESCSTCAADCGSCPLPPPPPPPVGPPPPPPSSANCPWIKTTGGDVHSNTSINTPC